MNFRLNLTAVAFIAVMPLSAANAAPQILGIFAADALPMHCADGICTVEVSAICLQEKRDIPILGTAYHPVRPNQIELVGTGVDGGRIKQPVGDIAKIETARGSWAVRIRIPEPTLQSFGIADAALSLDGRVTLLPAPVQGDPVPQSREDISSVVETFEKAPDTVVGNTAVDMAAANVMNELLNALPRIALDATRPAGDLWRKTFGATDETQPGMRQAAAFYRLCSHEHLLVEYDTLRRCLEFGHAEIVTIVNLRYWESIRPGV